MSLVHYAILLAIQEEEFIDRPRGGVIPINVSVSGLVEIDFEKSYGVRLIDISLFNDGLDDVYVSVNTPQFTTPLKKGESLRLPFRAKVIKKLYLFSSGSSQVRGFGIY